MTPQETLEKLFEEVRYRISQSSDPVTFNKIKQTVAVCLDDMQYIILQKNIESVDNSSNDFERIIEQNTTGDNITINGASIIQQLASEGWVVIPPAH